MKAEHAIECPVTLQHPSHHDVLHETAGRLLDITFIYDAEELVQIHSYMVWIAGSQNGIARDVLCRHDRGESQKHNCANLESTEDQQSVGINEVQTSTVCHASSQPSSGQDD
jgi:hypothetical protein